MSYSFQRNQFGYTPQQNNQNQFNTEFIMGSVGQNPYQTNGQQMQSYGQQGYGQMYKPTDTSFQNYMTSPLQSGAESGVLADLTQTIGSNIGAWGALYGAIRGVGDEIKADAMSIDPETGAYDDYKSAYQAEQAEAWLDPATFAMNTFDDPNATNKEKLNAIGNIFAPGLGMFTAKDSVKRQEEENIARVEEAKRIEKEKLAEQNKNLIRQQRLSTLTQNTPQYGAVFKNGGFIKSYKNGGSLNTGIRDSRAVSLDFKDASGVSYYPSYGTNQVVGNLEYMPIGRDDNGRPIFVTQNRQLSDSIGMTPKHLYHPDRGLNIGGSQQLQDFYNNPVPYRQMMDESIRRDYTGSFSQPKANGGFMENVSKNPDVTYFANGGTHESNPLGGIPQGPNANVESGEFKVKLGKDEYIFSDRF